MIVELQTWHRDESGLEAVEWLLLLAVVLLPVAAAMFYGFRLVQFYYAVTSWIISLPFP